MSLTTVTAITEDGNYPVGDALGVVLGSFSISVKGSSFGGGTCQLQYSDNGTTWYNFEQPEANFASNTSMVLTWVGYVRLVVSGSTNPVLSLGFRRLSEFAKAI